MAERELDGSPVKIKLAGGESGRADYSRRKSPSAGWSLDPGPFFAPSRIMNPEVPANSHDYARNMLWRTVTVLPLADRQCEPYASSVTIAASIDRADVRPFSLHTKLHHGSYRCS